MDGPPLMLAVPRENLGRATNGNAARMRAKSPCEPSQGGPKEMIMRELCARVRDIYLGFLKFHTNDEARRAFYPLVKEEERKRGKEREIYR